MAFNRRELLVRGGTAAALGAGGFASPASAQAQQPPSEWQREADVVIIGSGACGLPAAIVAKEAGSSVIVVEAQPHVGGHARVSGGNMPLGGGTSVQKRYGIQDSPDLVFEDLTDWSVVQPNGFPDYRYNDREIIRAFADNCTATFEFLREHGVVFVDKPPDRQGGSSVGNSVLRTMHAAPVDWPLIQTGAPATANQRMTMSTGNGLMQPLDAAARKAGVEYPARAQDDRHLPRGRRPRAASSASRSTTTAPSSTSGPARRSSSRPAARPATSTSAACSIRA